MSRNPLTNIVENLIASGPKHRVKTPSISNLSVIAGVVIIIVFIIVYTFFI